jgi:hypothetical protein
MPAQKRPLPQPASDGRVAERHAAAAASRGGGGDSRGTGGEAATDQGSAEPQEPRDGGEPNDAATPLSLDARKAFDALGRGRI